MTVAARPGVEAGLLERQEGVGGSPMARTRVFVYGTLKRGQRNHQLLANQHFVAEAETLPLYRLYDCGRYPCLVEDPAHGVAVCGEIWEVDEATLARLDEYEGVPTLYRRAGISVKGIAGPVLAYFYNGTTREFADCGGAWPAPTQA